MISSCMRSAVRNHPSTCATCEAVPCSISTSAMPIRLKKLPSASLSMGRTRSNSSGLADRTA